MNIKERFPVLQSPSFGRYMGIAATIVVLVAGGAGAYWYYTDYRPDMLQAQESDWMSEFASRQKYFFKTYSQATALAAQAVYFDKGIGLVRSSRQLPGEVLTMRAALAKVEETLQSADERLYRRANNNTETLAELKTIYAAYGGYGESLDVYAGFLLKSYDPGNPASVAQKKQMGDALRAEWAKRIATYQQLTQALNRIDNDLAEEVMPYAMVKDNDIGRALGRVGVSLSEFE